jgi:hypothetical protein
MMQQVRVVLPVGKNDALVVYVDFGDDSIEVREAALRGAGKGAALLPWWAVRGPTPRLVGGDSPSVEAALLRGLGASGLQLHACPNPDLLPATPSTPAVVLVRRSAAQGGDVAALQITKRYAQLGVRALALTDALSFDDFASALPAATSSSAQPQGDGGALVACVEVKRAHSFCLSRVAEGVWLHCSTQIAAGVAETQIANDLRKDLAARLGMKEN